MNIAIEALGDAPFGASRVRTSPRCVPALLAGLLAWPAALPQAQPGEVILDRRISQTDGGFTGQLDDLDLFGQSVASLGDLDGDGVGDIAVGAMRDDDGGPNRGAVWILFLNANGTVKSTAKVSDTAGGFTGVLDDNDEFGSSVANLGDLNNDGVVDLAVGAAKDDDGGTDRGAVWVLFLNAAGGVQFHNKISATTPLLSGLLDDVDLFGFSVCALGDFNGDNIEDLAVGAVLDDDGGTDRGAVWLLMLKALGGLNAVGKLSATSGNLTGPLADSVQFGTSIAALDRNADGVPDLAVGSRDDDDGGPDRGAVWVLQMNAAMSIAAEQKISATQGGFSGALADGDRLGSSVSFVGDLDGDGISELAAGAPEADAGGPNRGAVWVLHLAADGTVLDQESISATSGGFSGLIEDGDNFGFAACLLKTTAFGCTNFASTQRFSNDGGSKRGAVSLLRLSTGTFTNLGNALFGTPGFPLQTASGLPATGNLVTYLLSNAKTQAPSTFVLSLGELCVPLKGGVLVPSPMLVLPGFNTGFIGKVKLESVWPSGIPAGLKLYTQFWTVDAGSPKGLSASNAVVTVTQ